MLRECVKSQRPKEKEKHVSEVELLWRLKQKVSKNSVYAGDILGTTASLGKPPTPTPPPHPTKKTLSWQMHERGQFSNTGCVRESETKFEVVYLHEK